ncbi:MAG: hypothetical protein RO469_15075 [Thermincola sp.]|jgi:hypothetical protein|nr:hypothetical protein [Thermincola sp.]MDT3702284.1 hypothetical protein [Thermincola sp.]
MELCSFWAINPADGQDSIPEPVKLIFDENGDITIISLSEDPEFRGAYKLPVGFYSYSGNTLSVNEESLGKITPLTARRENENPDEFRSALYSQGLINDREWDLFYANPTAWKSLRIVIVTFGDE